MSRIAGLFGQGADPRASRLVEAMLANVGVGNLDVRALPAGAMATQGAGSAAQAMGCTAIVDGTFYNPEELEGDAAQGQAHQLIATYRKFGMGPALARINGDFAAALFDKDSGVLWLGRDRIGVRPLYFAKFGAQFAFASRIRSLLTLPGVSRDVNARYVAVFAGSHYRYIDNAPTETPFAGVTQLQAGHVLECNAGSVRTQPYWTLSDKPDFRESEQELAAQYRELLLDAVKRRYARARAPIFTLSGGMDSSSVLASAAHISGRRQNAVSSVYSDKTYDESDDIRGFVAEKVKAWQPIPIEGFDLAATVTDMVRAHDEPVATATWLSHFLIARQLGKQGNDVVFGGLGGDELNAGEYEYFVFNFADLRAQHRTAELEHEISEWARHHDHPIYRKDRAAADAQLARLAGAHPGEVRIDRHRMTRYYEAISPSLYDLSTFSPALDHPFKSYLKNRTYQDIFRETAPCCLRAEDRNLAAFGMRNADPFFDYRLVEFMFQVPGHMKIRDGVTKRLLREAMKGILPEETRTRIKKTGWNAPAHVWFSGPSLEQLLDLVGSRAFRERGVYNVPVVERIIAEHRDIVASGANQENHMMFLWQLVNIELWYQEVVEKVAEASR
jgi:asparagine synthase (glutamine-hydrolysing)